MNKRKSVLLVEDDPEICTLIAAFLVAEGWDVTLESELVSAISTLSTAGPFDLIILDFWLGQEDTTSLLDTASKSGEGTPTIMISGGNREMDLETTEAVSDISGAVVFLQKPFQKDVLLDAVRSATEN